MRLVTDKERKEKCEQETLLWFHRKKQERQGKQV